MNKQTTSNLTDAHAIYARACLSNGFASFEVQLMALRARYE
jgi:hypothetical protein